MAKNELPEWEQVSRWDDRDILGYLWNHTREQDERIEKLEQDREDVLGTIKTQISNDLSIRDSLNEQVVANHKIVMERIGLLEADDGFVADAEMEKLEQRIEALKKDKERLDFFEVDCHAMANYNCNRWVLVIYEDEPIRGYGESLRHAIDNAKGE